MFYFYREYINKESEIKFRIQLVFEAGASKARCEKIFQQFTFPSSEKLSLIPVYNLSHIWITVWWSKAIDPSLLPSNLSIHFSSFSFHFFFPNMGVQAPVPVFKGEIAF